VTCYTQPCKLCKATYILHYLPQGGESSPRGSWGICAPALPEVLTTPQSDITPPTWHCTSTSMPLTSRSPTHGAVSEVCFSWGTNPQSKKHLPDQSSSSQPSSKTWSPQLQNQKLERAFITPKVVPLLNELGHTQPPMPLRTDNSTAYGIVNETIKKKRSK
jgi:hypothetical protein